MLVNLSANETKDACVFPSRPRPASRSNRPDTYQRLLLSTHISLAKRSRSIHVGQSLPKLIVRATSAFRLIATTSRTRRHVAKVPSRKSVDLSIASSAHSSSTKHLGFMSIRPARFSSSTSHNMASIVIGSHFLASVFWIDG